MVDPANTLYVVIQVAISIAGFAGIISAVQAGQHQELLMLRLFNLLSCSVSALFISAFALVLMHAGLEPELTWRLISALIIFVSVAGIWLSLRYVSLVRRRIPEFGTLSAGIIINGTMAANLALQLYNILVAGVFWLAFAGILWPFGLATYAFTQLLLESVRVTKHDSKS